MSDIISLDDFRNKKKQEIKQSSGPVFSSESVIKFVLKEGLSFYLKINPNNVDGLPDYLKDSPTVILQFDSSFAIRYNMISTDGGFRCVVSFNHIENSVVIPYQTIEQVIVQNYGLPNNNPQAA